MIRILIADDHPLVLDALSQVFEVEPDLHVQGTMTDGLAVIEQLPTVPCDVLVLDMSLPKVNGFAVLRHVLAHHPATRVLVYTMHPHPMGDLGSGHVAWLCKTSRVTDVLAAVRRLHHGQIDTDRPVQNWPHEQLSPRQQELLHLLCQGASPGDLARHLNLSPSTVSTHLATLRNKLGVQTNGEILLYAARAGLLG